MNLKKIIFSTPDEHRLYSFYSDNLTESCYHLIAGGIKSIIKESAFIGGLSALIDKDFFPFFALYGGMLGLFYYSIRDVGSIETQREKEYNEIKKLEEAL